jgi:hypothetical protein
MSSTILPSSDATYDLGSSSLRWKEIYASNLVQLDSLSADQVVCTNLSNQLTSLPYSSTASPYTFAKRDIGGNCEFGTVTAQFIYSPSDVNLELDPGDNAIIVMQGDVSIPSFMLYADRIQVTNSADATAWNDAPLVSSGGFGVYGKSYLNGGIYLPSANLTPALLDTNAAGTISNNWGGAISSTSGPIRYSKTGNIVAIAWEECAHLGNGSTTGIASTANVLPAELRPASNILRIAMIQNNGTWGVGHVRVLTSGTIEFYSSNPSGSFNGSGMHYIPGDCFCYPV